MYLGLDLSTSIVGYTVLDSCGIVQTCSHVDLRKQKGLFEKVKQLYGVFKELFVKHNIKKVFIEESLFVFLSRKKFSKNFGYLNEI